MRRIICYIPARIERAAVARSLAPIPVEFCQIPYNVVERVRAGGSGLILDPNGIEETHLHDIAQAMTEPLPVLLVVDAARGRIEPVIRCAEIIPDCRLALSRYHALSERASAMIHETADDDVGLTILSRAATSRSPTIGNIIAAAAIVGATCVSVHDLARICSMGVRTLEMHVSRELAMSPKRLLMWSFALHATWQIGRERRSAKAVAARAGLPSEQTLGNRIMRVTGSRITGLKASGAFHRLLDTFVDELAHRR